MDAEFWCQRWEQRQIGFHLDEVNPYLCKYWSRVGPPPGSQVFVPLCGKSLDLIWLAAQGFEVLGIEISPVATRDFFKENGLSPQIQQQGKFEIWSSGEISIMCGDFFDLQKEDLKNIRSVYDRASLIAFPEVMRPGYVAKLESVLPAGTPSLLITLAYEQQEMQGPPFAVLPQEVTTLFQGQYEISTLCIHDVLEEHERFKDKGLTSLLETVYLLH